MTRMNGEGVGGVGSRWLEDLALCVGAGIYEELVFRLALISLLVIVGSDVLRFSEGATLVGAVLVAAFVFSLHHHPPFGSDPFDASRFVFRALAGVYLGAIFVYRGYGPAAGTHIAHNVLVLALAG
jgi:membrane protease YdiL (CAAX protease family)